MNTMLWQDCPHCDGRGRMRVFNYLALRQRRTYIGVSLRAVARHIGITAPYLSDMERGHRKVTKEVIASYQLAQLRKIKKHL